MDCIYLGQKVRYLMSFICPRLLRHIFPPVRETAGQYHSLLQYHQMSDWRIGSPPLLELRWLVNLSLFLPSALSAKSAMQGPRPRAVRKAFWNLHACMAYQCDSGSVDCEDIFFRFHASELDVLTSDVVANYKEPDLCVAASTSLLRLPPTSILTNNWNSRRSIWSVEPSELCFLPIMLLYPRHDFREVRNKKRHFTVCKLFVILPW